MDKKIFISLFLVLLINTGLSAQCTYTSSVSDVTLQCIGGTPNRSGIAFNPLQNLYYSVNAGNSVYTIETFGITGGAALSIAMQGQDYRGYWWNSSTNLPEGNTVSSGGVYSNSLNASFYATAVTSSMGPGTMPTAQSCGQGDIANNQILYFDNGVIYKYNKTSGVLNNSLTVTGLPASLTNINTISLIYTGVPGQEVGLYDYVNTSVYFVNYNTGAYSGSCDLPGTAPASSSFQMGFGNNRIFLFNALINGWIGYPIVNPTCVGSSLHFDGTNDYIQRSETNFGTGDFSIELWVKPTSFANEAYLVTNRTNEFAGPGYWYMLGIQQTSGLIQFIGGQANFSGGFGVYSSTPLAIGVWQHIAAIRKGTEYKIYVNGILKGSTTDSYGLRDLTSQSGNNRTTFGAWGTPVNQRYYNGNMDELRLWNLARTQCEIQSYMNCEIPTTATGLVANYHFNQGLSNQNNTSVTSLIDASGNASTGTLNNFALVSGTSNWTSPGGVASGNTVVTAPNAEINVVGNGASIVDGDLTPSLTDFTDFGTTTTRTFVIQNTGTNPLNLQSPYFTGTNASDFTISVAPSLSVAPSGATSLVVLFTPTSTGVKTATFNMGNNDCSEPVYDFVITATAVAGSALNFDGMDDEVDISPGINISNQPFTVEFWAKRNGSGNGDFVLGQGTIATNNYLHIGFRLTDSFTFAFLNNDLDYSGPAITDGAYHHWACVYDNTLSGLNRFIYLDGVLMLSDFSTSNFTGTGAITIGQVNSGSFFNGEIDELRIWNTARTQCEIQAYMNCEIPTTATGLLANYHFNQGIAAVSNSTVTSLIDAAASNTGTLTNFALTANPVSNWTSLGGVVSGFTTSAPPTASISLSGNSNPIANNSILTSTLNFTDFGTAASRTFVIQNSSGTLNISVPYFTGINASDFSVTVLPNLVLNGVTSTSFVVAFTPTASGVKTVTVNINDNDCNIPLYKFAIEATPPPAAALSFDGSYSYVEIPNSAANNFTSTNAFTVEFWAKTNSDIANGTFINKGSGAGQEQYSFDFAATDFRYYILDASGFFTQIIIPRSTVLTVADGWVHIAGVYDGSSRNIKLYRNGIEIASLPTTTVPLMSNTNPLSIGAQSQPSLNAFFSGQIDELRLWNTVRSQCEIQTYMNCEIPTTATGLVGNYHFNQGSNAINNSTVTTLVDASASASTGTLINFSLLTGTTSNWVAPGGVVSGYTTTNAPTSSLSITGNGIAIAAGSISPLLTNYTDFGTVNSRTFVIQSSGGGTMYINTPVTLLGTNISEFSITSQPSSSITTGTTNFVVAFTPTALGTRTAIVNVTSSDCTSPNYSFVIAASATVGAALNLDGSTDIIDCGTASNLDITYGTWESWVKFTTLTGNKRIFFKEELDNAGGAGGGGFSSFFVAGTNKVHGEIKVGSNYYDVVSTTNISANTWYHLAITYNASGLKLYLNGILESSNTTANGPINSGTGHLDIGGTHANPAVDPMDGVIDEVRLWNRALCQNEIQAQMNCELLGSENGLILYYQFNNGLAAGLNSTVSSVTDIAGSDNNATLLNFSLNGPTSNWIYPGAVNSGSTCSPYLAPDINLIANAITIPDGNTVVATVDNTDFGNISTTSVTVKNYTIQNTGNGPLTVSSITMSGADASMFIVGALTPPSPISASSSAVFSVTFAPTSIGTKSATVNITNNDCDEGNYDFVLSGSSSVGAALTFDGSNDYVNCGNILTASYTKEAWIKIGTSTNGNNILSGGSGVTGHAFWAPGQAPYNYKLSAGHDLNWSAVQDPNPLSLNVWHHVAVTYDAPSTIMTLYKNGSVVATGTVPPYTGSGTLSIGGFGSNFTLNGSVDEVRIWNRPLCTSEIVNNMNCEIATTAPGLIANYHFNQGIGYGGNTTTTLVTDVSGSLNTGTLVNFATTGTLSNWVPTSTITTGTSCTLITVPEINVVGNGTTIIDGSTTSSLIDHTDFGALCVNTATVRTYTIQNTGSGNLTVSGISLSGTNASDFTVGLLSPASPILPSGNAVFSVTFSPTSAGTKTAIVNIANNDCNESPYDYVLTGTCNALPSVSASTTNSVICDGSSTTLNGGGADTYTWTGGTVTNGVAFNPSVTLTYTVTGTNTITGCTSTNLAVQTITVNPTPTITANSSSLVLCYGESATLTTGGASNYSVDTNGFSGSSTTVAPQSTTAYSLTGTSSLGCVGINTVVITITVNPLPIVTASASSLIICNTESTSLTGGGADTYTWTGGIIDGAAFSPTQTATYSVSGTYTLTGCTSTNVAAQTISVNPTPTVTTSSASTVICEGQSATLTASGATSYTWNPGNITTSVFNPTPSITSTYSVIGTSSAGCTSTNTAIETVSINVTPTVNATVSNSVVCLGSSLTANGSGAQTYTWTGGITDAIAFTPSVTSSFSVIGTNSVGCVSANQAVISVTVNSLPSLTVSATKTIICLGESDTLNVSGAQTYSWTNGSTTATTIISPSVTTNYTVIGTDSNGCVNTTIYTQSVLPCTSDFIASASILNVTCKGKDDGQITISSSSSIIDGEMSYVWSSNVPCPLNNCDTIKNLKSGTYSVTVKLTYTTNTNFVKTDSVLIDQLLVTDVNGDCEIKVYSGISANGDGINDFLIIKNIEQYPDNKVSVYNRWGQQVFQTSGYNNIDKVWPTNKEANDLPSNTYFYMIDLGNGSALIKGWVELIKN